MHFYRKSSCVRENITCLKEVHLWYFPEGKLSPLVLFYSKYKESDTLTMTRDTYIGKKVSSETFLEENVASYMHF